MHYVPMAAYGNFASRFSVPQSAAISWGDLWVVDRGSVCQVYPKIVNRKQRIKRQCITIAIIFDFKFIQMGATLPKE
jgi:hypothetical protein